MPAAKAFAPASAGVFYAPFRRVADAVVRFYIVGALLYCLARVETTILPRFFPFTALFPFRAAFHYLRGHAYRKR